MYINVRVDIEGTIETEYESKYIEYMCFLNTDIDFTTQKTAAPSLQPLYPVVFTWG